MPPQDPGSASGPAGGGWRRKPKTSAARRLASMPPSGGWSQRPDREPQRAAWVHRLKVSFWALLLLALVGGFVVWLIWTPTMTPFLVAAVTDYDRPLPPNAWATEDLQRLRDLDAKEVLQYSEFSWDSKQLGLDRLRDQLYAAKPGGPGKDLVIIYLSMHGVVDGRGEPCLAPPAASASDTGQWLPVRELLDGLFPAAPTRWPCGSNGRLRSSAISRPANRPIRWPPPSRYAIGRGPKSLSWQSACWRGFTRPTRLNSSSCSP